MSDHNWVLENLESYLAGGLDALERERLEAHLPECASCSQSLQEIRAAHQQLESLFSPIRPQPGFEDRMIFGPRTVGRQAGGGRRDGGPFGCIHFVPGKSISSIFSPFLW